MRAELKLFWSPDVEDLSAYSPSDPTSFGFFLQLLIGPADSGGEESFGFMVCTPRWLEATHKREDIVIGRHHLLVFEYNYQRLVGFLTDLVSGATGDNWEEIANKLARSAQWEFEDYTDAS